MTPSGLVAQRLLAAMGVTDRAEARLILALWYRLPKGLTEDDLTEILAELPAGLPDDTGWQSGSMGGPERRGRNDTHWTDLNREDPQ